MGDGTDLTFEQRIARHEASEHYLNNPIHMARFCSELLATMRDPDYVTYKNRFDWNRFACEFSISDFDPPLDIWELFHALRPHFARNRRNPPRSRVWWLIRLVEDVEYPIAWLQQRQIQGDRGELARIAKRLNCFAISSTRLCLYLNRQRPSIPSQFENDGMTIVVVREVEPSGVWGMVYLSQKKRLARKVIFYEAMDQPSLYRPPPYEQSPQAIVKALLDRNSFNPQFTLYYPGRFIGRDGRVIWGGLKADRIDQLTDRTPGPVLVEDWDEHGWPVGHRIAVED